MRVIVGSDNGLIRETNKTLMTWGIIGKNKAIEDMVWEAGGERWVIFASEGVIRKWDSESDTQATETMATYTGNVVGLEHADKLFLTTNTPKVGASLQVWSSPEEAQQLKLPAPLSRLRFSLDRQQFVCCGQGVETQLWDVNAAKPTWKAKGVIRYNEHNRLWGSDVSFHHNSPAVLSVISRYGRVKTYDTRQQRKPIGDVILGENLHRMIIDPTDRVLSASSAEGSVIQFDLRTQRKTNALRAPAGTVRALSYHPTAKETLAVAGLDRFLYIYHRHKLLKFKHYIKLATCSLLFSSEPEFNPEDREEANIKGQEQTEPEKQQSESEDEIWDAMPQLQEGEENSDQEEPASKVSSEKTSVAGKQKRVGDLAGLASKKLKTEGESDESSEAGNSSGEQSSEEADDDEMLIDEGESSDSEPAPAPKAKQNQPKGRQGLPAKPGRQGKPQQAQPKPLQQESGHKQPKQVPTPTNKSKPTTKASPQQRTPQHKPTAAKRDFIANRRK